MSYFKNNEELVTLITTYFQPVIIIIINFGMIPLLIDISVEFEDYRRKSSKQISIMRRIFFMLFINIFLLPITQFGTAQILFEHITQTNPITFTKFMSNNFISQWLFYLKFII